MNTVAVIVAVVVMYYVIVEGVMSKVFEGAKACGVC